MGYGPTTFGLRIHCSTDWANGVFGSSTRLRSVVLELKVPYSTIELWRNVRGITSAGLAGHDSAASELTDRRSANWATGQ